MAGEELLSNLAYKASPDLLLDVSSSQLPGFALDSSLPGMDGALPGFENFGTENLIDGQFNTALDSAVDPAFNIDGGIQTPLADGFAEQGASSEPFWNKGTATGADLGMKAYSLGLQREQMQKNNARQNEQIRLAKDAYARNVESDENRKKLNF